MSLQLTIPAPGKWVSTNSNRHKHFQAQAAGVKPWRQAAKDAAERAGAQPFTVPVRVVAEVHKSRNNRWDLDGITPTVKACIDGLRDAGVLAEDDDKHIRRLELRVGCVCQPAHLVLHVFPGVVLR